MVAHVDAGKTTTTEQMLFHAGVIRAAGRVDAGTTQTDYLAVERERGISVRAATTALSWKGHAINLVDTPGHTDFVSEVERSLQVLDGAVLVISAAEGVQAHTETLWHALRALRIPTLLFVNKLDRLGADPGRVLRQIAASLTDRAVPVQALPSTEHDLAAVAPASETGLLERLAELNDELALERYVAGNSLPGWAFDRVAELARTGEVFPVLFGSSLKGIGVSELLDAVLTLLPPPRPLPGDSPSGLVFKVERDPVMGRLAYVRLYRGALSVSGTVPVSGQAEPARVVSLRKTHARHHTDIARLEAGDIGVVSGLGRVRAGDILGDPDGVPPAHRMAEAVLRVRLRPARQQDLPALLSAVAELADEDPHLAVHWQPDVRELHVTVMGSVQVEILQSLLATRFGLDAAFDPPSVIYREVPVGSGEGQASHKHRGYAWVKLTVEPGAPGSGLQLVNRAPHDHIYPQFAGEALRAAGETLQQGLLGWQVTDAVVTLLDGAFDSITSVVGNYTVAAPMAVMSALAEAGTRLLEPVYTFRLSVPAAVAGRIMGQLMQMRAVFEAPVVSGDRLETEGLVPVATSLHFPAELSGLTAGRGILSLKPAGYQPAPPGTAVVRTRVGTDPLDRAKYMLGIRGAL